MSEDVKHSQPRGWKAFQANFDDVMSRSDRFCEICLSEQQVTALLSLTEYLYWPTRWVRAEGEIDPVFVQQFTEDLERQLLMACCDDNLPIQYRYSSDGVLERSMNAGGNWIEAPEYDPRVNSPQFPIIPVDEAEDPKCVAAAGAATLVKAEIGNQITGDMTRYTLSQLISDWTKTYIGSSNPFLALLTVISNQIFALVLSALSAALTDPVYHQFQCILFCRMSDNLDFNLVRWGNVRSDITSQIGGIAGIFLEHLVYLLGTGGLTNLVRAGGVSTGDCSDCTECAECTGLFSWPTASFGANSDVVVDVEAGTITAPALLIGVSYYWGFQSEVCCQLSVDVTAGTFTQQYQGVIPCPDLPEYSFYDESNPPWTPQPLTIANVNCFAVLLRSSTAFTAKITFTE